MAVVQLFTFFGAISAMTILFMNRPFWFKVKIGVVPALLTLSLASAQLYFAWKAWISHPFNKVDFLVNEFLKALMGSDLSYRKLMARHRLHKRWLWRYCYCPPTTNLVSEGFPEEIWFVTEKTGPDKLRADHVVTEPIVAFQDADLEQAKVWPDPMDFMINDILLTITKDDTKAPGKTWLKIKVRNTLVNESITLERILPDTGDFDLMMTVLWKWARDPVHPDFSFVRFVYKDSFYAHCYDIRDFFDLVGQGKLDFVKVRVPLGTRVYVGCVR